MKYLKVVFNLLLFPFVFVLFLTGTTLFAASNSPTISISSGTDVAWGTDEVILTLTASPEANVSSITVEYHDDYHNTNTNITIDVGIKTVDFPISTAGVPSGSTLTITLNSAIGDGNQSVGGIGTGTATITITNTIPEAKNNEYKFCPNDTSITGNIILDNDPVSGFDFDPDGNDISLLGDNSTSEINITNDGAFTYTPAVDFYGDYSFDYNITDGDLNSSSATVTIYTLQVLLDAVDDNFTFETRTNTTFKENVLTNDGSTDYDVVPGTKTTLEGGSVTIGDNGAFTYTPITEEWTGTDSFTYTVLDSTCDVNDTATVTIDVYDMCFVAEELPLNDCSDNNHTTRSPTIIGGYPQVYWFTLPDGNVTLDLNISVGGGQKTLTYDFQEICGDLFTSGTDSYLPQGASIDIRKPYPKGDYYLGLDVSVWDGTSNIEISVCYDTNSSGLGYVQEPLANVGVNNRDFDHNTNQSITTKVVNKRFGLRASYLGTDGSNRVQVYTYDGSDSKPGSKALDLPVLLTLATFADGTCQRFVPTILLGDMIIKNNEAITQYIDDQDDTNTNDEFVNIDFADKDLSISIGSIDIGAAFRRSTDITCNQSSLSNSLCDLPACLNNAENIKALFPPAFYPKVLTCVQDPGDGGSAPCDQNAYEGNCGGLKTGSIISPDIYNHDLGCYDCLQQELGNSRICSDRFAVRPKAFDVNITTTDPLTVFKAGKPTNLSFLALDENGIVGTNDIANKTLDYNQTQNILDDYNITFKVDLNVSNNADCEVKDLNISPNVDFYDGIHQDDFSFSDIGNITMSIHEINIDESILDQGQRREFAKIDIKDTPAMAGLVDGIEVDGRLIEPYDANFTVIPDHFNIEANLSDHNTNDNFTYLHDTHSNDDYSMASVLTMDIKAMNYNDINTTRNYTENCYAKNTTLTLNLEDTNITYSGTVPALTQLLYFNPSEYNSSIPDSGEGNYSFPTPITSPISLTLLQIENTTKIFPDDGNGTANIEYKLNFDRTFNLVVNPFRLLLSDVNITEVDPTITDPEDIVKGETGSFSDQNATYYYGRAKSSLYFYEGITDDNAITPIQATIYCNLDNVVSLSNCSNYELFMLTPEIGNRWFFSANHNASQGDGNVTIRVGATLIEPSGISSTDQTINGISNPNGANIMIGIGDGGSDDTVQVSRGSTPLPPLTVPLELVEDGDTGTPPYTNAWLIYNEFNNSTPTPFYKVRFTPGPSGSTWTGVGKTGHAVDLDPDTSKPGRMDW